MTVELKPEQQRVIDLAIQSGACRNPEEVLDQALEMLREQLHKEEWLMSQREAIAAQISEGFAQSERGEVIDGEAAIKMLRERRSQEAKRLE